MRLLYPNNIQIIKLLPIRSDLLLKRNAKYLILIIIFCIEILRWQWIKMNYFFNILQHEINFQSKQRLIFKWYKCERSRHSSRYSITHLSNYIWFTFYGILITLYLIDSWLFIILNTYFVSNYIVATVYSMI